MTKKVNSRQVSSAGKVRYVASRRMMAVITGSVRDTSAISPRVEVQDIMDGFLRIMFPVIKTGQQY